MSLPSEQRRHSSRRRLNTPASTVQADIQSGSVVYALQCSQCHGPTGDQVGGIDLRSGRFRNNVANDDDLRRIITNGIPNTSMPGRKLAPAELTAVVAYIRNMRDFNTTVVKLGDSGRGRTLFEGNGCGGCHRIGTTGSRVASDLSEIGSSRSPGSHPAGAAGSQQHDDAHQPAGARRDQGRAHDQRPPAE